MRCLCSLALLAVALCAPPHARGSGLLGSVKVSTDPPGARVFVNGQLMGTSPCTLEGVGAGLVEVKADAQGYAAAVQTVEVKGDETVGVDLRLQRLANVGALDVRVKPDDSLVELDRLPVGRTPALLLNIAAGTHRLEVSADGYRTLVATVTVGPDERHVVDGRLVPTEAEGDATPAADLQSLGRLDPGDVPALADLAEGRAFDPVRKLLRRRDYDVALGALDGMARQADAQQYALRIGRDRGIIRRIREVVETAYRELGRAEGQDYVLLLRGGIRLAGRLTEVTPSHVTVSQTGGERRIALEAVSAGQLVRLASPSLRPEQASHLVSFALLHAAEGEFAESYAYLRDAAEAGYTITSARSFVDAEHVWQAAVEKDRAERRARAATGNGPQFPSLQDVGPVSCLIDNYHGRTPPQEFLDLLTDGGAAFRTLTGAFTPQDSEEPAVLVVFDQGGGSPVPRFDRQELQSLLDFVQRGGSILFVGAQRPVRQGPGSPPDRLLPHPFDPLLRWYGITVRRDRTELSDDAPEGYPRDRAVGFPASAHPVARGARSFVVPIGAPTLSVEVPAWVAFRAGPNVESSPAGGPGPVLVAGRDVGQGRVVVMSSWPASGPNDSMQAVRNALAWLAQSAHEAALRTP